MQIHVCPDTLAASGTLDEIRGWLTTNYHTPLAINALWLDPISDQIHLKVEVDPENNSKSFINDFSIILAEGAIFSPSGWQPLGHPIPLIPYNDRDIISSHLVRPYSAPNYYQPVVKYIQQRASHINGILRWRDSQQYLEDNNQPNGATRLVHASIILPTIFPLKKSRHQPNFDFYYNLIRIACKAPPWHPRAGYFLLSPLPPPPTESDNANGK